MPLFLLDSDALIDYLNGYSPTMDLIHELEARDETLCVNSVSVGEALSGVREQELAVVSQFISSCEFLTIPYEAAVRAGRWRYEFARQGIALSITDMLIAATAVQYSATLVTGNARHFPMPELSLLPLPR
jgi:predicted nucleic acid-binding protein